MKSWTSQTLRTTFGLIARLYWLTLTMKPLVSMCFWLFSISCQHITLCEILFRCKGFYTKSLNLEKYNNKVLVANQALRSIAAGARGHVNISFWEHKDLKQSGQINTIFHADGVHLRQRGLPLLYRSMRGAVLHLLHHTPRYAVFLISKSLSCPSLAGLDWLVLFRTLDIMFLISVPIPAIGAA